MPQEPDHIWLLDVARKMSASNELTRKPSREPHYSGFGGYLDPSIIDRTRGYIEKITVQINICYDASAFDGCLVMIRRLLEILIIEVYDSHGCREEITKPDGTYYQLSALVDSITTSSKWNLGREAKAGLVKLREVGNRSAHGRRYIALRQDADMHNERVRIVVQELIYLADLK